MNLMAQSVARQAPASVPATVPLIMDVAGFEAWLRAAHPGSRITYHRGHLCVDRAPRPDAPNGADREAGSSLPDAMRRELGRIADRAMDLALEGRLHLVQERRGKDVTAYLVVMGGAG